MPRNLPPIAPRASNARSDITSADAQQSETRNLTVRPNEEGYEQALAALAADKRRFLVAHHPIKDALHLALQQPAGVLLQRYAGVMRTFQEAQGAAAPSDDPGERSAGTAAELDDRPAIIAYTETLVAKAILGDTASQALVSDRIEGKPGLRKADLDAETAAQRERVRDVIGVLVEQMVERRAGTGDAARVIEGEATEDDLS